MKYLFIAWKTARYGALALLLLVFFSHAVVRQSAVDRIATQPTDVPEVSAALLLGTSRYTRSGRRNEFFANRIQAAVDLIEAERVQVIVASGDSSGPGYDEPTSMYNALRDRNVPAERIILDHAGLRTLDSVYRMHSVYRQDRFVIISQRFHLERALFLASQRQIDATGYIAADASGFLNVHIRLREYFARVQAVLDAWLFQEEPFYPGGPIELPELFDVDSSHANGA